MFDGGKSSNKCKNTYKLLTPTPQQRGNDSPKNVFVNNQAAKSAKMGGRFSRRQAKSKNRVNSPISVPKSQLLSEFAEQENLKLQLATPLTPVPSHSPNFSSTLSLLMSVLSQTWSSKVQSAAPLEICAYTSEDVSDDDAEFLSGPSSTESVLVQSFGSKTETFEDEAVEKFSESEANEATNEAYEAEALEEFYEETQDYGAKACEEIQLKFLLEKRHEFDISEEPNTMSLQNFNLQKFPLIEPTWINRAKLLNERQRERLTLRSQGQSHETKSETKIVFNSKKLSWPPEKIEFVVGYAPNSESKFRPNTKRRKVIKAKNKRRK